MKLQVSSYTLQVSARPPIFLNSATNTLDVFFCRIHIKALSHHGWSSPYPNTTGTQRKRCDGCWTKTAAASPERFEVDGLYAVVKYQYATSSGVDDITKIALTSIRVSQALLSRTVDERKTFLIWVTFMLWYDYIIFDIACKEKAENALWFAETYGLVPKSLWMTDTLGKEIHLSLGQTSGNSNSS